MLLFIVMITLFTWQTYDKKFNPELVVNDIL